MAAVCNCTDLNRITRIVDGLVKEAAEEKAHLANQLWVIVIAYIFVILPWGLLYNVDFISEKWRTVHRTRFLGWVHIICAIAPMPFIVFYAHLQQTSQDYKEMMTAVIAILMSSYHVVRSGWGLIQLSCFSKWCSVLLQRMWKMRMIRDLDDMKGIEEVGGFQGFTENAMELYKKDWNCLKLPRVNSRETDFDHNTTNILENADVENRDRFIEMASKILRVNNTVVDNELGGTDLTVKVDWNVCVEKLKSTFRANNAADEDESRGTEMGSKSGIVVSGLLSIEEKELCAVRWSGSFLSSFGEHWNRNYIYSLLTHQSLYFQIDHDELMGQCESSLAMLQYVRFPANEKNTGFPREDWKAGGPYGSNLDLPELHEASEWLNHRKRELENIMGSFPTSEMFNSFGRQSIALVTALLYAQCIDEDIFDSLIDYESGFTVPPRYLGWEFLLWQNGELPNDCESNFMGTSLPPFPWGKLLVPLWDKCTNWRVLQASVHADNDVELYPDGIPEEDEGQPSCWFEYTRNKWSTETFYPCYSGTILESVRSFLSDWMCCRSSYSVNPEWCPTLPAGKFQFSVNQEMPWFGNLWRWECQSELHEVIAGMNLNEVNLPGSIELVLLFILGLPGNMGPSSAASILHVSEENSAKTDVLLDSYEFSPGFSPQDIKVGIQIFEGGRNEEKNVSIELIAGASITVFRWEDWINSAMGCIKGVDDALTIEERDAGAVPWRNRTPRKVNLNMPLVTVSLTHEELSDLRGDIQVWRGWPFFDIKIAQFETNQWMRASGRLKGYCEFVHFDDDSNLIDYFGPEVRKVEEGLMMISEWADSKWETVITENRKEMGDVSQNV